MEPLHITCYLIQSIIKIELSQFLIKLRKGWAYVCSLESQSHGWSQVMKMLACFVCYVITPLLMITGLIEYY